MQLRNKLHPLMLLPDNLSRLAKKYGHFQVEIPLDVFCRDLSKFTQFQPWQLHQALYKMLNSQTISWSSFLELLKDDCKTRSNLITELLDQNQSYCFALEQGKFQNLNEDLKLSEKEDIRQFNRIFLFNYSFSILMLDDELLIVEEKQQNIVSKLTFNPIPQERQVTIPVMNPEKSVEKEKDKNEKLKKPRSKLIQFPSQILESGLRTSKKNTSLINKTSSKVDKKPLESILDLSLDQSINFNRSGINQAFDNTLKYPSTMQAHPSPIKSQFNPWRFVSTMKSLKTELSYNPHFIPLQKKMKSVYMPKDKQIFNRALTLNKKIATSSIPIQSFSVDMDYVAVILKNKQLRLLKLKKYPFNKIVTNVVLTKTFKWFPVYIHLFRTILNENLHILIAFQLDRKAKIKAFKLVEEEDKKTQLLQSKLIQMYSEQVNFSPLYQPMNNYFGMYDEFGRLQVLDLTCRDNDTLSTKFNTKIQNPYLNKSIPISACTYHPETFTLVIGCKNGYLHTLSQHSPEPKRHKKITNKREISSLVCSLQYVIALTIDGICLLVNPYSLNEMNRIDLNEHDIRKVCSLYKIQNKDSVLVYGKTIQQLNLVLNKEKVKQIRRSKYQHLNKVKLLDNELPAVQTINQDIIHKVKISEDYLVVIFETSNIIKVFSSLKTSTSFVPDKETTSIIDVAIEKKGNLIAIAYDSFDVQVRNIYNQNLMWSITLNDFPNCLIFISKDHTSMLNVNTEEGNINIIDSKGVIKTIYNTKTSLTSAIQTKNNLIIGDCFGSIYIFTETSMKLLHQINLKNSQGIKLIRDIPKQKIIRVLSFGNTIYDIDIQNGRVVMTVSPKCEGQQIIHDVTETGFIQQTSRGIFVGQFIENKQKIPLRSRISSRSKYPSADMMAKSILRMASNSILSDDSSNIAEDKFIHYDELNIQKEKIRGVHTVMNRLTIVLSTCTAIHIDSSKKTETVNLLN